MLQKIHKMGVYAPTPKYGSMAPKRWVVPWMTRRHLIRRWGLPWVVLTHSLGPYQRPLGWPLGSRAGHFKPKYTLIDVNNLSHQVELKRTC